MILFTTRCYVGVISVLFKSIFLIKKRLKHLFFEPVNVHTSLFEPVNVSKIMLYST